MNISVVVPFFNEERHIEKCIDALVNQDFPKSDYELIFVDNNSTDRSADIAASCDRVRLVHESKQGDYAARNRGLSESRGQIVAFTDADTAPCVAWLNGIDAAMREPNVLAVVGGLRFASPSSALCMLAAYEDSKMRYIHSSGIDELVVGYTCNMAVRREVLLSGGGFPPVRRNAEVVFLRRLISEYGTSVIQYRPDVQANRLEISSLTKYYSKLHLYGTDCARYSQVSALRALTVSERLVVFRDTVRRHGYSLTRAAGLLALLVVGGVLYDFGRILGPRG